MGEIGGRVAHGGEGTRGAYTVLMENPERHRHRRITMDLKWDVRKGSGLNWLRTGSSGRLL
jgi:hypothetical protein